MRIDSSVVRKLPVRKSFQTNTNTKIAIDASGPGRLVRAYARCGVGGRDPDRRGFIENVPREIEEAALVDGASPGRVLWSVTIPLIRPGRHPVSFA